MESTPPQPQDIRIITMAQPAGKKDRSVKWWHVILVLIGAGVLWKAYDVFYQKIRKRKQAKRCFVVRDEGQIAVLVHSVQEAGEAVRTILSLARKSYCIERLHFYVFQEIGSQSEDVYSVALQHAKGVEEETLVQQMRVITMDVSVSGGKMNALAQLLPLVVEKWCVVVSPGLEASLYWDSALISSWKEARGRGLSAESMPIISSVPDKVVAQHRPSARPPPRADDLSLMGTAATWIQKASDSTGASSDLAATFNHPPSFPVIAREFNGRFPVVTSRMFPAKPHEAVEVAALSAHFAFGNTATFKYAFRSPVARMPVADYAMDWSLSNMLYNAHARFFAPNRVVFVRTGSLRDLRPKKWDSRALAEQMSREFAAHCGVDLDNFVVSGRAQLGLLSDDSHEVLDKIGSRMELERIKSLFL